MSFYQCNFESDLEKKYFSEKHEVYSLMLRGWNLICNWCLQAGGGGQTGWEVWQQTTLKTREHFTSPFNWNKRLIHISILLNWRMNWVWRRLNWRHFFSFFISFNLIFLLEHTLSNNVCWWQLYSHDCIVLISNIGGVYCVLSYSSLPLVDWSRGCSGESSTSHPVQCLTTPETLSQGVLGWS